MYILKNIKKDIMDAIKLAKVIQVAVQEAIKQELHRTINKSIKKVIKEELSLMKSQIIKELKTNKQSKPIKKEASLDDLVQTALMEDRQSTFPQQKNFSTDPLINKILNETANNSDFSNHQDQDYTPYKDMFKQPLQSQDANTFGMSRQSIESTQQNIETDTTPLEAMLPNQTPEGAPSRVSAEEIPDALKKALTRDYSGLVKKMAEPKHKPLGT